MAATVRPYVLLHGHPHSHVCWHLVAPQPAEHFTVVCPDLRGYGESSKPPTTPDYEPYSKRAMARDMLALRQRLGHKTFSVAGHDRGSYGGRERFQPEALADYLRALHDPEVVHAMCEDYQRNLPPST